MMILRIKKVQEEFVIELDKGEALHLKESVFVRHNLYKGKELTEEDIKPIVADQLRQEAIDTALPKLRNRKTEEEIRRILYREGFEEVAVEEAIAYLNNYGLLDDREYATLYARDKRRLNGHGPIKIRYALRQKGVDDAFIDSALSEYSREEEEELILKLVEKKYLRGDSLSKPKPKIIRFLLSRGFNYDAIKAVLRSWD